MRSGKTLVLGGARSGKSGFAETLLLRDAAGTTSVYIATAEARDDEMRARIAQHRIRRDGQGWRTLEAPLDLPGALAGLAPGAPVLIDCLTLWLTNVMLAQRDVDAACTALRVAIAAHDGPLVAVANEVGLGIVPENALARRFRDAAGRLNQDLAKEVGRVVFVAAGLPLVLKGAL
ncbi:MAG: bifunctional adenosylcobinamide kinase/adenosylcobinamide-phosphate guanylyltransferase [Pararhodobacter sp.]